ncbi:MAG: urea ABC transporter permease subunit UrtB [Thiocapsa sp.]|nr:urea ABC transporter permease subunit UrtB [Thiocapsa sp.]MCG6985012.1 urea ABC transporter permease subunit UrtB [Thiocapsa sp.]
MPMSPTRTQRRAPSPSWHGLLWGLVLLALIPLNSLADALDAALIDLSDRSFEVKQAAVEVIAVSGDPRALKVLEALLDGDLYARTSDRRPVLAAASPAGFRLRDALEGTDLGEADRRDIRKITINNRMRTQLRSAIAALTLASPDAVLRLSAARELLGDPDPLVVEAIRAQFEREEDKQVRDSLALALALASLRDEDPEARLSGVSALAGSLDPSARNALTRLLGEETDPHVRAGAQRVLAGIEQKLKLNAAAETLFFGLSLGSVLVLAAIGLAITFGVMGVINMAHGELIMIGAYSTYLVQQAMPGLIDYSLFVAIPAAFLIAGLLGVLIERTVIRFLYGRPLETLLATFGISLILQQLVRTTISAQNVAVQNPSWMSGALQINPALALTYSRLYILVFALLVFLALLLILKRTALGLQVRAVSQNRSMARALGVRSARVDALTFGLGAGVAGVAGVALSQLTNVGPNMGQAYIIDSFMVVVFGGVGNLWGTLVAGLTLGVANKLMEPWAGAVLAKILVLVFIILFIQKRPRGLFPQRGRAADG